jgi:hypothetical protein
MVRAGFANSYSPPFPTKTEDNPDAVPAAAIEAQDNAIAKDFAKWVENERPFGMPDTIPETRTWLKTMTLSMCRTDGHRGGRLTGNRHA